jgi:RNA polymerase sigma-70 factor (ECF subfamily)
MAAGPIDLLARARAGQDGALGELCALYRNYLRMLVRAGMGVRLRERVELSDVVQEALVEVVRQFPQFTGQDEAALLGWLRRLVGQRLADLGRYHSRAKRGGGSALPLDGAGPPGDPADPDGTGQATRMLDVLALSQTSPSEAASRRELTVLLADALQGLPEDEAEILWLYHVDGLSFSSIGVRLGLNRKVVRGVWTRGLMNLRRQIDPHP